MTQWMNIILLFLLGAAMIVADIFLPSHMMLTACAAGLIGYALYLTYQISPAACFIGVLILIAIAPAVVIAFLRMWPRTWLGRRVAPANPVLSEKDRMSINELRSLVGQIGRSITPHRPVGTCVFDGWRVECVAEHGTIPPGVAVEAIRLVDRTLCVRPVAATAGPT